MSLECKVEEAAKFVKVLNEEETTTAKMMAMENGAVLHGAQIAQLSYCPKEECPYYNNMGFGIYCSGMNPPPEHYQMKLHLRD